MRFGVTALFLLSPVGCSSSEALEETTPKVGDDTVTSVADSAEQPGVPSAIENPSEPPRPTDSTQIAKEMAIKRLRFGGSFGCPFPASACPDYCVAIGGARLDEAMQCVSPVVVGCLPPESSMNTDLRCYQNDDGVIVEGSGSLGPLLGSDWSGCRIGATRRLVASASACP
ncbi:MAG: hypothetical protein KF764_16980 [Labilithrix sp.]|nr:hypothetical protein [Labilithrix sp.]